MSTAVADPMDTPTCPAIKNDIINGEYVRRVCGKPATWKRLVIGRPDRKMFVCDSHKMREFAGESKWVPNE